MARQDTSDSTKAKLRKVLGALWAVRDQTMVDDRMSLDCYLEAEKEALSQMHAAFKAWQSSVGKKRF